MILEAAERLLAEGGRRAVTTTRVARLAGVGTGTLYQYFATSEALVRAVERRGAQNVVPDLSEQMLALDGRPVNEAVRDFVLGAMEMLAKRDDFHTVSSDDPETVQYRLSLVEAVSDFAKSRLLPSADRLRRDDIDLSLRIAVKLVVALTWFGKRDHPQAMATGSYQREIADLVVRYLLRDPE